VIKIIENILTVKFCHHEYKPVDRVVHCLHCDNFYILKCTKCGNVKKIPMSTSPKYTIGQHVWVTDSYCHKCDHVDFGCGIGCTRINCKAVFSRAIIGYKFISPRKILYYLDTYDDPIDGRLLFSNSHDALKGLDNNITMYNMNDDNVKLKTELKGKY
jgi:hypothetical protein